MNKIIKKFRKYWGAKPRSRLKDYTYLTLLTKKLDKLHSKNFTRERLYEIILWKVNRWPEEISTSQLRRISKLRQLKRGQHRDSEKLMKELLLIRGIGLPMASTIFRFANPNVFQIIDDRAFRAINEFLPEDSRVKYSEKPHNPSEKRLKAYLDDSCDLYFDYMDTIKEYASREFPFKVADRLLYLADKHEGNLLGK